MLPVLAAVPLGLILIAGTPADQQASLASPMADARTGAPAEMRPASGGPEEDVSLEGYTSPSCVVTYSETAGPVGPTTGDAEKDTVARVALAETCR